MKKVTTFEINKTPKGYEVFVYWEKRFLFPSLKSATKFTVSLNNLLFIELFKLNELYIEMFPYTQRLLFISTPFEKMTILNNIESLHNLIKYCHFPRGENKTVHIITKIEHGYKDLKELNDILFKNSKKISDTINVYKSKVISERLEAGLQDFKDFKFIKVQKLSEENDCKVVNIA